MTLAQFRLLGRAVKGEVLPLARYRLQLGAVRYLTAPQRRYLTPSKGAWAVTPEGRSAYTRIVVKQRN
jgi:hypothetical protein